MVGYMCQYMVVICGESSGWWWPLSCHEHFTCVYWLMVHMQWSVRVAMHATLGSSRFVRLA